MARGRKQTPANGADASPPNDHNGPPTDEEMAALNAYFSTSIRRQQRKADEAKAAYDAERTEVNSLFALVKGELKYSRKEFQEVLAAQDMSEAEFLHAETKRHARFLINGLPVGAQLDMFATPRDTADEAAMAEANGYRAGRRGDDPTPPKEVSPILHPDFMRGWSRGQDEVGKQFIAGQEILKARTNKGKLTAEDPDPEPEEDEADPEVVKAKARKLKAAGWTEPTSAETEFADA